METPISVVDSLMSTRAGSTSQPALPSNPLLRNVGSTEDYRALANALFQVNLAQEPAKDTAKASAELDWLLEDTPATPSNADTPKPAPSTPPTQRPVNLMTSDQQRQFKADFSLFDQNLTAEGISSAVAEAYQPGGGLQPITVPQEMLTAFAAGDFSGLGGLLQSAQLAAHQNAMSGVLNLLNALLPKRMGDLFDRYSSHTDEVSARTSIAEQHSDPVLQLALDAALSKYKAKYPNATAAQLKAVGNDIAAALQARLAPKATDDATTARPQPWDDFFRN